MTAPQVEAAPEVAPTDDDFAAATPTCGYCGGDLISGRDLDTGYHTAREDAYSCFDRLQEMD